ncbi:sperm-egg fusion protein TMEM95 [Ornithorhynchus anatinus]|uniref:sperm-egg fusion protein TMEM95 n=1 Tax=Ornithorhynchus anatinus TaxID=9258 RepID=UPI0010A844B4|nr:sperm-egg fusion protein TMEM95 [Ornithorhynchus anatinus]
MPGARVVALCCLLAAVARACVFCRLRHRDVRGLLARLCRGSKTPDGHSDHPPAGCVDQWDFADFALDAVSMDRITEKTYRVLRVMEINNSASSLPSYWHWLRERRLPEYTQEVLCPPICRSVVKLYNCSTCEAKKVSCWSVQKCHPDHKGLWGAMISILSVSCASVFLGFVSCFVESRYLPEDGTSTAPGPPRIHR